MAKVCSYDHDSMFEFEKVVVSGLPVSQRNVARHVCAFCAYEAGVRRGLEIARNLIEDRMDNIPPLLNAEEEQD